MTTGYTFAITVLVVLLMVALGIFLSGYGGNCCELK